MTRITSKETNTFFMMANNLTHSPTLLQEPEYIPAEEIDNTEYDADTSRFTWNGKTLNMKTVQNMMHYHVNMAALLRVGAWLDYLREAGVYDNTKIIIVADHGHAENLLEELIFRGLNLDDSSDEKDIDVGVFYPLLMVKDFESTEFTTSNAFMTNADVPTLAVKDLIENPVNPFTGKQINNDEKYAHEQFIIRSRMWSVTENNGNTFLPSKWASVKDNLWDKNNWTFYDKVTVLAEHAAP